MAAKFGVMWVTMIRIVQGFAGVINIILHPFALMDREKNFDFCVGRWRSDFHKLFHVELGAAERKE